MTPPSVMVNDRLRDEAVTGSTFDTNTTSKTPVPLNTNGIYSTAFLDDISDENQRLVQNVTPGKLSIVEVHHADVSKPETSLEAILTLRMITET